MDKLALYNGWCTAKGFGHESEKCPFCDTVEESELQDCFSCFYWWHEDSNSFQSNEYDPSNEGEDSP